MSTTVDDLSQAQRNCYKCSREQLKRQLKRMEQQQEYEICSVIHAHLQDTEGKQEVYNPTTGYYCYTDPKPATLYIGSTKIGHGFITPIKNA